jgi:hypothetical protein
LQVSADGQGLRFASDHYYWRIGQIRWRLPGWLAPGHLTIDHIGMGGDCFAFALTLAHPRLGELIHQLALFRDNGKAVQ